MLNYSPENLLEEAKAAEEHALKTLKFFPQVIQTLVGSYYRSDMIPSNPSPENYPASYVNTVKPRLIFSNPRFTANSLATTLNSKQVLAQAAYVNSWTVQNNLQAILDPFVSTALLVRSVILTAFEDDENPSTVPQGGLVRKTPKCYLIENHRYFRDPVSTPAVPPRFKGHIWVRDLEDVKKMPGVKPEVIEQLTADSDLKMLQRPNDLHGGKGSQPPRFEIVAYEIWVPECNDYSTDRRGHHGTIFTIAYAQAVKADGKTQRGENTAYLLEPRPYYGPAWGPYTELEYITVPGQTYGTSPVSVVMQQVEELNAHLSATADAAARMKHLLFIDAANDTLQIAVSNSPDGSLIGIPNITKDSLIPVLIGGPAAEQYTYNEVMRQRLDRNIGMDAAQRGGEVQDKTATATNIQYESLNVRMAELKRVTTAAVRQIANTVSWYGWENNGVVMEIPPDEDDQPGTKVHYYGGPQNGETLPPWDAAALDLEPYSMEVPDEDKLAAEVTESLAIVAQLAQDMQAAPWIGWDVIIEQLAKLRKFDWLAETINGELFAAYQQEQVQQNIEQHQMAMAEAQAQLQMVQMKAEQMQIENAKKKVELMAMMRDLQNPKGQEGKPPSISISYKDLPEDMKRLAELEGLGASSTQPLTSPTHIGNAMDLHKTNAGMQHEKQMTSTGQKHDLLKQKSQQTHQVKQSKLAGMLRNQAARGRKSGGMSNRNARAQTGPTNTAGRGQRSLAEST